MTVVGRGVHLILDRAFAEAMARDDRRDDRYRGPDIARPVRFRTKDLRMSDAVTAKVLLMQLSECLSNRGSRYLRGYLGKASVVAFESKEPDRFGRKCWDVYVSTPRPKADRDAGDVG